MPSRSELGSAAGAGISAVGAGLSYVSGSTFLTAILAALTATLLTIYFNGLQQKQAWKRETAVKFVGELYGPLYLDVSTVLQTYSRLDKLVWGRYSSDRWTEYRRSFYYLVIEQSLLKELEGFYALLDQTSKKANGISQLADSSLLTAIRTKLGADTLMATWLVTAFRDGLSQGNLSVNALEAVVNQMDLASLARQQYSRYREDELVIKVGLQKKGSQEVPYVDVKPEVVKEIFIEAGKTLRESREFEDLKVDYDDLVLQGEKVRTALASVVKAPWNV
jgi:hypothetical protein